MFKALARWAMAERRNAIIAIAATLAIPLLFWLGAAIAALSILRHGFKEASQVVLWGALPSVAWLAMGDSTPLITLAGASLLAAMLRQSVNLGLTLIAALAVGLVFYLVLPIAIPEALAVVQAESEALMAKAFEANPEAWQQLQPRVGPMMVGALAAMQTLILVLCLLLARWWQAAFYNPGGYSEEFHQVRLPAAFGIGVIFMMLGATALPPAITGILPILTIPLVITACAIVHAIVARQKLGGHWLFVFYLCVFLFGPYFYTLLIFIAALDGFTDIRKRLKDTTE